MSEPDAEQVINAARKRKVTAADGEPALERAIQPVTFQVKPKAEVAEDDSRVVALIKNFKMDVAEARKLVAEVGW